MTIRSGSTFRVKGRGDVVYRVLKPTKRQRDIRLVPIDRDGEIVSCSYGDLIEVENVILDAAGRVLNRSKAWTRIRTFTGEYDAEIVNLRTVSRNSSRLEIRFVKGYEFRSVETDRRELLHAIANWRQLYGRRFFIDDDDCGTVSIRNPVLKGQIR